MNHGNPIYAAGFQYGLLSMDEWVNHPDWYYEHYTRPEYDEFDRTVQADVYWAGVTAGIKEWHQQRGDTEEEE